MLTDRPADARRIPLWLALAGFILLCVAAGWLGSIATTPAIPTWYAGLEKPPFNPPNSVFPIVWTTLYVLMGIAAWRVWRAGLPDTGWALRPFFLQLALNVAWSFAFFGAESPALGFLVISLLWLAIVWCIVVFRQVDRWAAILLLPYLAWVSFAAVLNGAIWALNPG
jgi:tryptophan-rich sensory protein